MPGSITIVGARDVCGSYKAICGCTERTVTVGGWPGNTTRFLLTRAIEDVQALSISTTHIRRRDPIRIEEPPRSPRPRFRKKRGMWRD